jgi:REP element-mobilizing transposase RayT
VKGFPERKPNRLKDYDYSQNGAYFITICAKDRQELFATIDNSVGAAICRPCLELLDIGRVIDIAINRISQTHPGVRVDKYVIMPNHVHMILEIDRSDGRQVAAPTIQAIIGQMKRFVSMQCGVSAWQKSFHDHIIRNEEDYLGIAQYIETNPDQWETDCFNARGSGKQIASP